MMHPLLLCLKINLVLQIKPEHLHIHRHLGLRKNFLLIILRFQSVYYNIFILLFVKKCY